MDLQKIVLAGALFICGGCASPPKDYAQAVNELHAWVVLETGITSDKTYYQFKTRSNDDVCVYASRNPDVLSLQLFYGDGKVELNYYDGLVGDMDGIVDQATLQTPEFVGAIRLDFGQEHAFYKLVQQALDSR